ncbi:MAG: arylsulfatase [Thermoguttaceae bacterium]
MSVSQAINQQGGKMASIRKSVALGVVVFSVLCGLSDVADAKAKTEGKPNIIYIMADDLGYGDLSCFGQKKFQTPNLDRMAAEGMKFTQHYSGSTVCAPSRCCLMTGMHSGHAFIRGNREVQPEGQYPIPQDTPTLAKLLKGAGYRTGMFGKWGLGAPGSSGDPMKQGFDEFFGYNCQRHAHSYYVKYLWHNTDKVPLHPTTYAHDVIVQRAMQFIKDSKGGPFFCYMPVTIPHASMHVPEESAKPFRAKFPEFEDKVGRYAGPTVRNPIACFAGMVTRLDSQIGKMFELLDELGIDDNTLVIFTSDNGPHREGGHEPTFFNSTGPLRGIKRDLYEGGIRVPTIARWPGHIKAGEVNHHISAFWDVLPTCAELAGVKTPQGIDGLSFLPTLLGNDNEQKQHEYLYWEFAATRGSSSQAVRLGDWKAVRVNLKKNPHAPIELYNLKDDIGEENNVAAGHPEVVAKMKAIFEKARVKSDIFKLF